MRRIASGLLAALLLLSVGLVAATPPARAFEGWEDGDPIVSIGGQTFTIVVGVRGDAATVRRSVREADITIMVPQGSRPAVLSIVSPSFREDVRFVEVPDFGQGRSKTVYVLVRFEASATLPTRLAINGVVVNQGDTRGILYGSFTLR